VGKMQLAKYLSLGLLLGIIYTTTTAVVTTESSSNIVVTTPPSKLHKPRKKLYAVEQQGSLATMTFAFSYSGDVARIPYLLREYDSSLNILPHLGHRQSISVNLDLAAVKIQDIIDAISTQTMDRVNLLYDSTNNTLRLSFTGEVDVGQDAVDESLKWQNGGNPRPILKADGVVRFPYGEYQPVVTCQPLNLCDIELQAGEEIQGIVIGDSLRWNEGDQGVPIVYSGPVSQLVPHLVLKPTQSGLETSLMVTTSKRTYMIKLKSADNGYVARVGFYYPQEMMQNFENNKALLRGYRVESTTISTDSDTQMPLINLSRANYAYKIQGDDYVWKPTQVLDDGTSVYIQMPEGVSSRSLPGLCVLIDGDDTGTKCEMVNFRYNDHFYIVDKLFNQAKLINGFGDYTQTVTITRNPQKGFWARLFGN